MLCLLAQGRTDAQIAVQLVISPRTVNKHTTTIYSKIGVSSRSVATRYTVDHKLLYGPNVAVDVSGAELVMNNDDR